MEGVLGVRGGVFFDLALRALGSAVVPVGRVKVLLRNAEGCGSHVPGAGIVNCNAILIDERPHLPNVCSRELRVGRTDDFADGGGGYGGEKSILDMRRRLCHQNWS